MSLLKVSQLTLIDLGVYSWGSLGCGINDVPFLNDLMVKEGKVCGSLFDRFFFFFASPWIAIHHYFIVSVL